MRALLSVVGTRGDVQPVLALALEVRALGHEVRLAVPPNFVEWATRLQFEARPVGIEMRAPRPGAAGPPNPLPDLIGDQFDSIAAAAEGCGVILGANAHQYAARSIAETRGIPYVDALYAPTALPNDENRRAWNERALDRVNHHRARFGLEPIDDVLTHVVTDRPWLATDPVLDDWPARNDPGMVQTGAWILHDSEPLSPALEAFLDGGEPPVYFGFGSMPVRPDASRSLIEAARACGRRAIVSAGWGALSVIDDGSDCLPIDEVNQQALFPRVAAVVHHGGAGTTLTAGRAGIPQLVAPMFSDQPYWGSRVSALGVGASLPFSEVTTDAVVKALGAILTPSVSARAREVAGTIRGDGALEAARRLIAAAAP